MPNNSNNYERVLEAESETNQNYWVATLGEQHRDHSVVIDPNNPLQGKWGSESGKNLRILGKSQDVYLAEAKVLQTRVIFYGVLYNSDEGLKFNKQDVTIYSTHRYAESVLRAYLQWGEETIIDLKGVFSLIIWDKQRDILLCVRDRIGNIPLFYTESAAGFFLSTSIDALLAQDSVVKGVNRVGIAEFFCNRWPRLDETYQKNIFRIPAGYVYKVKNSSRHLYRYWEPIVRDQDIDWISPEKIDQFESLLDQAMKRCLNTDKAGIFLSGGLDSVTVATLATEMSRKENFPNPVAYSLIFPYPGANEEDIQRSVANKLQIHHLIISLLDTMGPDGILASAIGINIRRPVPLLNLWVPGYQFLTLSAKESGIHTILTGGGGDEWLGVSPLYGADLIRSLQIKLLFAYIVNVYDSFKFSPAKLIYNVLWKYGTRPILGYYAAEFLKRASPGYLANRRIKINNRSIPDWLAPDPSLRREMDQRYENMICGALNEKPPKSFYIKDILESLDHPLVSMEYEESFEGGRRFGVHKLAPFQDYELAEFLIRTPPTYLNKGRKSKGLIRNMLAKRFPDLGFDKQKKRAGTQFFRDTLLREGSNYWANNKGTPTLYDLGIVDKIKFDQNIQSIFRKEGQSHQSWLIWHALCLDSWCKLNY